MPARPVVVKHHRDRDSLPLSGLIDLREVPPRSYPGPIISDIISLRGAPASRDAERSGFALLATTPALLADNAEFLLFMLLR